MGRSPVTYAEQDLKVHELYEEHARNIRELQEALARKSSYEISVRETEFTIKEHEMDLAEKLRSGDQGMSIAAFERELKAMCHKDEEHHRLRTRLMTAQNDLTKATTIYEGALAQERATRARLYEISSLLRFYGASKEAVTAAKLLVHDPARNWP